MNKSPEFSEMTNNFSESRLHISPLEIDTSELAKSRPNYVINPTFNSIISRFIKLGVFSFPKDCWRKLSRIDGLDEKRFFSREKNVSENLPFLGEIADANFQELERATTAKWYYALNYFFHSPEIQNLRVHGVDKRIKIAIPGCFLGFEIGALIDFFNDQGISIDVQAVDKNIAGSESTFMNLAEREKKNGSTVEFKTNTDAKEFFSGTKQDIAIFRHPGSVHSPGNANQWKEIFKSIMETDPALIIVSTFDYKVSFDVSEQEFGPGGQKKESDLFKKWLAEGGYIIPTGKFSLLEDDSLVVPSNPYMYLGDNNEYVPEIFDRKMFIAVKNDKIDH